MSHEILKLLPRLINVVKYLHDEVGKLLVM